MLKRDCDVIIVGGGPVGLGLAIDLAQRGIAVDVLERSTEVHDIPKGQNLTQRSAEHFRAWGVLDAIEQASPIPREFGNAGLVAYGTLLGDYQYDWFKRGAVGAYYFERNQRLPQYATELVLRERAAQIPGLNVRYGCKAISVDQDDDQAAVTFQSGDAGSDEKISASYVVGCDGSRSVVREAAAIDQNVDPHHRKMALLVFRSPQLHQLLERFPGKSIYNILNPELDGYWQFLGRVDLDGGWFYHAPVPEETELDNFDFAAYLHKAVGAEFHIDFQHIGFWDLRIAQAKTYRNKRIFIAGDSAHSHPPYGGYGINTGFEDARNLSWKLAADLQGWGGDDLLASYDAERRPVFASTSQDFIARMIEDDRQFAEDYAPNRDRSAFEQAWNVRADGGNSDVTQFLPHYEGSPIISANNHSGATGDGPGARGRHMMDARPGHHLAPVKLSSNRDLFDSLQAGFALISIDGDSGQISEFVETARNLNLPLSVVEDDGLQGRDDYKARYVLVRPDHFIAWAGNEVPANLMELFQRAIGSH